MLSNQLKKPAKAREMAMATIAMLALFFMGYNNFFVPKLKEARMLNGELQALNDKVSAMQKLNKVLKEKSLQPGGDSNAAVASIASQDPRVQLIQRYKKQKYVNISAFFEDVTSPAFRSALNIDSMKYDPTQKRDGYSETKFTLVGHGDYLMIMSFLKKLENVPALVALDAVQINVSADSENVSISLAGTFFQLEDSNV